MSNWTMKDVREFVRRKEHIPDDAEVSAALLPFPIHWARGAKYYINDLQGLSVHDFLYEELDKSTAINTLMIQSNTLVELPEEVEEDDDNDYGDDDYDDDYDKYEPLWRSTGD